MSFVDWTALLDALWRVERLSSDESGLLSFGEPPVGGIFVERGRICWVAARGLQRRLRDLLRDHGEVEPSALDRTYERCRAEGKLFGQALVAEGLIEQVELNRALRQHSAECLLTLCRDTQPTSFASHAGRGYAPQFTFSAIDLLLDVGGLRYPDLQREARAGLAAFEGLAGCAVAFGRELENGGLLPLEQIGAGSLAFVHSLGQYVLTMQSAGRELGSEPSFAFSTGPHGGSVVSWSRGALSFAAFCADRQSLARVTSARLELG